MLKTIIENDYQYGRQKECEILDKMNKYFMDNITQTENRFDTKDYVGDKNKYEVKSRRIYYKSYPTTIIPTDKVNENIIFLFNFIDGLYYIRYNKEVFSNFKIDYFHRRDGGQNNKNKLYFYIPINELTQII
jgi:hypothetical protein